mmetsp:Transcript_497/g.1167  ORF Transcript_497/g.1167 Transcript_497/m.1167 type:complete len:114 (-) Transcript_497:917-1258(-)
MTIGTAQRPASQSGHPEEGPRRLVRSKAAIKAAIAIQTAYRAWDARHKYLGLFARRRAAAIIIQSVVRAYLTRMRFDYVQTLVKFASDWRKRNAGSKIQAPQQQGPRGKWQLD